MRIPTLIVTVLVLVLLPVLPVQAGPGNADGGVGATAAAAKKKGEAKPKAKRKRCKKGYVLKTVKVKRKGKTVRVKRCRKKTKQPTPKRQSATPKGPGSSPTPTPAPTPSGPPRPLFDPPGTRLEGAAARPFVDRYLANSRFTDCPAGWPSCLVEQRYSHLGSGLLFFSCLLPLNPGAEILPSLTYQLQDTFVEPDGSWSFNETVSGALRPVFYDWRVGADGTVTGTFKTPGQPPAQVGPLQYVAGARTCGL